MRKTLIPIMLAVLILSACATIQKINTKMAKDAQITLAQAQAGLEYLQAVHARWKAAGAIPSLAALETDIANLAAVITRGDLGAAVALYAAGREEASKIAAALGK